MKNACNSKETPIRITVNSAQRLQHTYIHIPTTLMIWSMAFNGKRVCAGMRSENIL